MRWKIFLESHNKTSLSPINQFNWACKYGSLDLLKWHSKKFNFSEKEIKRKDSLSLRRVCERKKGNRTPDKGDETFKIFKWIVETFNLKFENILIDRRYDPLQYACRNGHFDIVRWVVNRFNMQDMKDKKFVDNVVIVFGDACEGGHLKLAKWILNKFNLFSDRSKQNFKSPEDIQHIFRFTCMNGRMKVAKWLVKTFNLTYDDVKSNGNNTGALSLACEYGHLRTAKWLMATFNFTAKDIKNDIDDALLYSCRGGCSGKAGVPSGVRLKIVKWIVETFDLEHPRFPDRTIQDYYGSILEVACSFGHLDIGRYLAERFNLLKEHIRNIMGDGYSYYALGIAIADGLLEVVKFMIERFNFNTLEDFKAIQSEFYSCKYRFPEIADYLSKVYSEVLSSEEL